MRAGTLALAAVLSPALAQDAPYRVAASLFDFAHPADLGVKPAPGTETFAIFHPRGGAMPLRFEGKFKRPGYHYPKSVVWNGLLYVAYAQNKEDIALTRVPLANLAEPPQ